MKALRHKDQLLSQRAEDIEWLKSEVRNRDEEIEKLKLAGERIFEDEEFLNNFDSMAERFEALKVENEALRRQLRRFETSGAAFDAVLQGIGGSR